MYARKLNDFKDYRGIELPISSLKPENDEIIQKIKDMSEIVLPGIARRIQQIREASQKKFDKTHKIIDYPVGSLVSIRKPTRTTQLEAKLTGPFKIVRKNKGGAYTLQHRDGELLTKTYPPSALKSVSEDPVIS
ncbi:hypothetical protein [Absidia glauca]|uniref:Uncharacterized protein n=1 Tax=Absidia glauca TaxID=4829 RepID=A0A163K5D2_ABSGL|nr:hypothetical protein [Absidia glauca]